MRAAAHVHDQVNLVLLPVLGVCSIMGLYGAIDTWLVTLGLAAYITADLLWIAIQPECLPSLPKVIMLHHAITLVLLSFPLRYTKFGVYTCLDGLAEVNTFFLIARRQWKSWASVHDTLYWITFIPSRIILYPALLYPFYQSLRTHSLLENVLCLGAQFLLCLFNFALLHMSLKGLKRRNSSAQLAKQASAEPLLQPALSVSDPSRSADMRTAMEVGTSDGSSGNLGDNFGSDDVGFGAPAHAARPSGSMLVQRGAPAGPRGARPGTPFSNGPAQQRCIDEQGGSVVKQGHLHDHSAALQVDARVAVQPQRLVAAK